MPHGSHLSETGWLNADDAGQLVLRRDGGGRWRLDASLWVRWRARNLIGRRVRLSGIRDGFDILTVQAIKPL